MCLAKIGHVVDLLPVDDLIKELLSTLSLSHASLLHGAIHWLKFDRIPFGVGLL